MLDQPIDAGCPAMIRLNMPFEPRLNTRLILPIVDLVKADPRAQKLLARIESGELALCAPFPGMERPWSAEKIRQLDAALSDIFATPDAPE